MDSSLLDEWEKMRDPNYQRARDARKSRPPGAEEAAADITRDTKAFTAAIRNRIFTFLRGLVIGDYEAALASLVRSAPARSLLIADSSRQRLRAGRVPAPAGWKPAIRGWMRYGQPWTADRLQQALEAYHAEHEHICLDPNARNIRHTYVIPVRRQADLARPADAGGPGGAQRLGGGV